MRWELGPCFYSAFKASFPSTLSLFSFISALPFFNFGERRQKEGSEEGWVCIAIFPPKTTVIEHERRIS